jgi:pimeloyl-ACP methyl ester carboxylesterase
MKSMFRIIVAATISLAGNFAFAQTDLPRLSDSDAQITFTPLKVKVVAEQRWFTYTEKATFGSDTPIKLEVVAYEPIKWNGKIVVINHGSTGIGHAGSAYDEKKVKKTVKFVKVGPALVAKGYRVFVLMRKGRGNSEGRFSEEDARTCSWGDQIRGVEEAEPQLDQFVDWVRTEYKVAKVIVMGHSRGGFLSAYYSERHPEKVIHTVNISGGWTTACEYRNNMTHKMLEESGGKFKNQTWIYATKDSYFSDGDTSDYAEIAAKSGVAFIKLETTTGDGHAYATANPKLWLDQVEQSINK